MSQPNTDRSIPPSAAKSGCGAKILKGLLLLIVIGAAVGIFAWQKNQATKRANLEESILTELEQPKKLALEALQASEDAKGELGAPIEAPGKVRRPDSGELDLTNARLSFDVSGTKAKGVVDAVAQRADGVWKLKEIKLQVQGGKSLDIPPPSADAPPSVDFDL